MKYPYRQKTNNASKEARIIDNENMKDIESDIKEISSRVTNIVASAGDSNAEIVDSRIDKNGTSYKTIKERLDADQQKVEGLGSDIATVDSRVSQIISQSGTSSTEVVDARTSSSKGKTFSTVKDRLEDTEKDLLTALLKTNVFDSTSYSGEYFNGAVSSAKGATIPAGQSGATTYKTFKFPVDQTVMNKLIGCKLVIEGLITTSDNLSNEKTYVVNGGSTRNGANEYNTFDAGTTITVINSTTVYFKRKYTIKGGETVIAPYFQISGTTALSKDSLFELNNLSLYIEKSTSNYYDLASPVLGQVEQKINTVLGTTKTDAAANKTELTNAKTSDVKAKTFTDTKSRFEELEKMSISNTFKNNVYDKIIFGDGASSNGAIYTSKGMKVPAGQTGQNAFRKFTFPVDFASKFKGQRVYIEYILTISPTLLTEKTLYIDGYKKVGTTYTPNVFEAATRKIKNIDSTTVYIQHTYILQGDEVEVGPYVMLQNANVATTDLTFDLINMSYYVEPNDSVQKDLTNPVTEKIKSLTDGQKKNFDDLNISVGLMSYGTTGGQPLAGATWQDSTTKKRFNIPSGSTGYQSYIELGMVSYPNKSDLTGKTVTFLLYVEHTEDFADKKTLSGNINATRSGSLSTSQRAGFRLVKLSSTLSRVELDYIPQSTDEKVTPFFQIYSQANTEAGYFELKDVRMGFTTSPKSTSSLNSYVVEGLVSGLDTRLKAAEAGLQSVGTAQIIIKKIKKDGTGDFASIKSALASVTDSSATKWYEFQLYDSLYEEGMLGTLPAYVRMIGKLREPSHIKGEQAASTPLADITAKSTLDVKYDFYLENLKITGKNCRYTIHDESSGAVKDTTHKLKNCHIEHYGNQEARDYQTSIGADPNAVWNFDRPYGYGASSGLYFEAENCVFIGSNKQVWYVHTREKFEKPNINKLKNCKLLCTSNLEDKHSITLQSLGSGQRDQLILEGCELNGIIYCDDIPWIPTELEYQYANHSNIELSGYGNTPVPYVNATRGKALRITSNNTSGDSYATITGGAAAILFGDLKAFKGKGGLKGYTYGTFEVSDMGVSLTQNQYVSGMFRRLGNRTTNPVTLTVQFEAKTPINIVFDEDYTTKDNQYILDKINTALGTNGVADLFNPALWDRPKLRDERVTYRNTGAAGLARYTAVRRSYIMGGFEVMSATDDVDDFLGFLEEDCNPGEAATIKIKGYMTNADVLKDGTVTFTRTNMIGISSSKPGYIVNTTDKTKAIGRGVSASYFRFKA